jgi:oligosaccharide repeat unit polymerase
MGQTVGTVQHTIELVPGEWAFSFGKEYLYGLFTVVPNLFWSVHPWESVDPADWLVQTIAPWHASLGMGFGYSFIAEAYLNFGLVGITLGMALIGFFVGKLCSLVNYNRDPAQIAALGSAVAFSFFWARGTVGGAIRPAIWQGLLPYLLVVFLIKLGGKATSFSDKSKRVREK